MKAVVLAHRVDVGHLPTQPVRISATPEQRIALAREFKVLEVKALAATVTLTPGARGSVLVEGDIVADIVQTCVVSLAPVDEHIAERFSLRFVRASDAPEEPKPGAEILIDAEAEDPPEILDGPSIDIGAVVEEAFALGINPYPRAPGAELPADFKEGTEDTEDSPFAALKALAERSGSKS